MKKIASVHTSVGPISTSTTVYSSESESIMGSVLLSKRINGRTLLAGTKTNRKRGRGEGDGGSKTKRIKLPWRYKKFLQNSMGYI